MLGCRLCHQNRASSFQKRNMKKQKRGEKKTKEAKKGKCILDVLVCISHHIPTEFRSMTKQQMDCKEEKKILQANLCGTWINGDLKLQKIRSTKRCKREEQNTPSHCFCGCRRLRRRFFLF